MLKVLNEEEKDSSWLKLFNEGNAVKYTILMLDRLFFVNWETGRAWDNIFCVLVKYKYCKISYIVVGLNGEL